MKLQFISFDNLEILKSNIKNNINNYSLLDNGWVLKSLPSDKNVFINSKIDIPDEGIKLIVSDHPEKDDFENIKILYSSLMHLTNCQAADERVWVALSHGALYDYMQVRWPISKGKKDVSKFILKNYFFAHGTRSLLTNGIARLWWFGKLTYQENSDNPYYLTEYLCKDLNGKGFPLLGSNFSNNKKITSTFLKTIKNFEENNGVVLSRMEFIYMIRTVNLWGGKMIIDSLTEEELGNMLMVKLDIIIRRRELIK